MEAYLITATLVVGYVLGRLHTRRIEAGSRSHKLVPIKPILAYQCNERSARNKRFCDVARMIFRVLQKREDYFRLKIWPDGEVKSVDMRPILTLPSGRQICLCGYPPDIWNNFYILPSATGDISYHRVCLEWFGKWMCGLDLEKALGNDAEYFLSLTEEEIIRLVLPEFIDDGHAEVIATSPPLDNTVTALIAAATPAGRGTEPLAAMEPDRQR